MEAKQIASLDPSHRKVVGYRDGRANVPGKYLSVGRKKIALVDIYSRNDGVEWLIVPGVVTSKEYKMRSGRTVVDVRPIKDAQFRQKVMDALKPDIRGANRQGMTAEVYFYGN